MLCPCCNQSVDQPPPVDSLTAVLAPHGHVSRRILELLSGAYPRAIAGPRLTELVYENDPDGGPEGNSMQVVIWHLRKKIEPYGWTIPLAQHGTNSAGYRLAPVEHGEAA